MLLFLGILVHFTTLWALFEQTTYAFLVSGKTVLTVKRPTAIIAVDMGRLSFLIISALPFFLRHVTLLTRTIMVLCILLIVTFVTSVTVIGLVYEGWHTS